MDITAKHKGSEDKIAAEYKDAYDKYINGVISTAAFIVIRLKDAVQKLNSARANASQQNADIADKERELADIMKQLERSETNHDAEIKAFIEVKRQDFLNKSIIYSDEEIKAAMAEADELKQLLMDPEDIDKYAEYGGFSREDTEKELSDEASNKLQIYRMSSGIVDYYGNNYGMKESLDDDNYTKQFTSLYKEAMDNIKNDPTEASKYHNRIKSEETVNNRFSKMYKKNPYVLLNWLWLLLALPSYVFRIINKRVTGQDVAINPLKGLYLSLMTLKDSANSFSVRLTLGTAWLVYIVELLYLIFSPLIVKTGAFVIVAGIVGLFFYSKKAARNDILEAIYMYICLKTETAGIDDLIDETYRARCMKVYDSLMDKYDELKTNVEAMINDNDEAYSAAAKYFNESDLDMSAIEDEYSKRIESLRGKETSIKNMLEAMRNNVAPLNKKIEEAEHNLQNTRESMINWLAEGVTPEGCTIDFQYFPMYISMYASMNGTEMRDGMGLPALSVKERDPDNDVSLPNKKIAISMLPISFSTLEPLPGVGEISEEIKSMFNSIVEVAAKNFRDNDAVKGMLENNKNSESGSGLDLTHMYIVRAIPHNCKCSIIFYNSDENPDYTATISNLITRNIYKSTIWTTDPASVKFTFVVDDKTEVAKFDPRIGSSEDSIRNINNKRIYVVSDGNYDVDIKALKNKAREFMTEIQNKKCNTALEYQVSKIISGAPAVFDYLIMWQKDMSSISEELSDIMQWSGGTQSVGSQGDADNICGVIPFIFVDHADILRQKPDTAKLKTISKLANLTNYNNFFKVGKSAETLTKMDRNEVLRQIELAEARAKQASV